MTRFLKTLIKWSAFVPVLVVLLFVGSKGETSQHRSSRSKRADDLFLRNCARCHAADGSGDTPLGHLYKAPDFTDPAWWQKSETSGTRSLKKTIVRGKREMPAFGKKLTNTEINLLLLRVRRFRQPN